MMFENKKNLKDGSRMTGKMSFTVKIMDMQERYIGFEDIQHVCNYEFEGIPKGQV